MKKIIIALLCLQLINLPIFASALIEDSFAEKTLQKKVKVDKRNVPTPIDDNFVNFSLTSKTKIRNIDKNNIDDLFVEKTLSSKKIAKSKKHWLT